MARHSLIAVTALSALGLAAVPAGAQAPTTLTFRETDKGSTFRFVDNPPRSPNPRRPRFTSGDLFVFSNPLVSDSGARRGTLRAQCTITGNSSRPDRAPALCYGVFGLKEGNLVAVVSTSNVMGGTVAGAIVGGTGAYANAHGTFKSVNTKSGSNDTITLSG